MLTLCLGRRARRYRMLGLFLLILLIYAMSEFRYHVKKLRKNAGDGARATASFSFSTSFDLSLSMFEKNEAKKRQELAGSGSRLSPKGGKVLEPEGDDEDDEEPAERAEAEDSVEDEDGSAKEKNEDHTSKGSDAGLSALSKKLGLPANRPKRRLTMILHTGAAYYNTRLKAQLDTWLNPDGLPPGFDVLIYTTDEIQPGKEGAMFRVNNTKKFSTEVEDYIAMNERVLQSFEHALQMRDSDFYMKIDDDTYVNTTLLAQVLDELDAQHLPKFLDSNSDDNINMYNARVAKQIEKVAKYAQLVNKPGEGRYYGDCSCITHTMKIPIKPAPNVDLTGLNADQIASRTLKLGRWKYACGGPGYLIDRVAMEKLVDFERANSCHRILEDITIGLCMDYVGVGCVHLDSFINYERMGSKKQRALFHVKPQKFLSLLKRSATIHKVLPENMYRIHELLGG